MKIGDNDNFLSIEPNDAADPYEGYRIAASCGDDGDVFKASNGAVHFNRSMEDKKSFIEFEALKSNETKIELTEGCSIKLMRMSRGDIQVDYQICRYRLKYRSVLIGQIIVYGEDTTLFLRELGRLAYSPI